MITVATLLWAPNRKSLPFSTCYDETWVERLYRGFARNLTQPFRFVCYTDRPREFAEPIEQRQIASAVPSYSDGIQPYELTAETPMILVGLDTIVTGNIDHLADYCLTEDIIALPRDPYNTDRACNGVALVPAGNEHVYTAHRGENDMVWMRSQEHVFIDDMFPGDVTSWKCDPAGRELALALYFHGDVKPHQLAHEPLIQEHWR